MVMSVKRRFAGDDNVLELYRLEPGHARQQREEVLVYVPLTSLSQIEWPVETVCRRYVRNGDAFDMLQSWCRDRASEGDEGLVAAEYEVIAIV
jgi:hypothetical protein